MTAVRDALAVPRRQVVGFFRGLSLPFVGAKLVYVEHGDLIRYWIVPLLVTVAVLIASTTAVFRYDDALLGWMWSDPGGEGWQAWLLGALHSVLWVVVDAVLLVLALVVTMLVGSLVAAPFNARLGEVIDERVTGKKPPPFAVGRVVMDLVRTAVIETGFGLVNLLLFVAGLVLPPAGPFLFVLGLVAWAYYFAIAYVDIPLATRGRGVLDRLRFTARHPMAVLGFGTGVGLFLMVPILNLLFMPAAVAGGVLLVSELDAD